MKKHLDKVKNILEALPYITEFAGKTIVVKYGGAAMVHEELKESFARDIVLLKYLGINPVIVHGGGPFINTMLKDLKVESEFVRGHRRTDVRTMEVVEMVLSGTINKQIASLISSKGGKAVGISGRDAKLCIGEKYMPEIADGNGKLEKVDIGLVGSITRVNTKLIDALLSKNFIPVISPISESENGDVLNVNADNVAGAIAGALNAEKLILLTDTEGIIIEGKPQSVMKRTEVEHFKESGEISGGMIPKVDCCLKAMDDGVHKAHIIDGRVEHSVLLELLTDTGVGTLITPE
ncbi:MAG: acetylglutamate kinase [Leptospiraceae bacterium]|nr:acetylglutamate kinase [Leptospiraceae bacterium]